MTETAEAAGCELKIGDAVVADATGVIEVRNPARWREVVGSFPLLGPVHVDRAVALAAQVQPEWAALPAQERFDRMMAAGGAGAAVPGLAELLTRETGKTLAEEQIEPAFFSMFLSGFAPALPWLEEGETLPDEGQGAAWRFREPFGVVGAIAPANYPLLLSAVKLVPALLAGNAVVLVAPPTAPLGTLRSLQAVADALPAGLLTVLSGPGATVAQRLAEHPGVRKLSFTGSVPTGASVVRSGAGNLKAVGLELGGNDAALVLDDCVLDEQFFQSLALGAFTAAGQVCFAIKRVYAPSERVPEIANGLAAVLDGYKVGDPLDPEVTMGPVHTEAGRARARAWIDEARAAGAVVRECGELVADEEEGWFLRPALVVDPPNDARIVQEEQFAPALPIVGYRSLEEAITMVNDTEFGLGSSIWSPDVDRAVKLSRRIQAGATFINAHGLFAMDFRICLSGVKRSGIGEDGAGKHALAAFTEPHAVSVK